MIGWNIPLGGMSVKAFSAPGRPPVQRSSHPLPGDALNPLNRYRKCVRVLPILFQTAGSVGNLNARGERLNRSPSRA
jgi:hypothetical protein